MLCRLRASTAAVSKARMATLVATEEFPIKASLSPKATTAAVIKSNTVEGGLQVITRDCTSSFVSLKFAVAGGSSAETANTRGSANLLATAAFAGNTNRSGMELVHHLESVGASFHAYADKEKIVYDVKVLADQAESAIAAVVNAIALPPRAGYVLDELKDVAQLEYNKFTANPSAQLRELVQEAAFGEGSPLGASRFTGSLKKLSAAQALEFRSAQFVRGNVVIAANGISQERLGAVLGKTVDEIPAGAAWNTSALPFVGSDVKVRADLDGVSRVGLAFPVPAGEAGKPYAVLNALLAAKLSSQKQCASSFLDTFRQNSLFGVEMAGQASGVAQQLEAVVAELKNIAAQCPSIDAVKQKLTLEYFLALEGTCSTEKLLCAHLRGLNAQSVGDLRSVTPASVSAAAAASLKANPAYAVLGATAGTPSYAAVVNMLN